LLSNPVGGEDYSRAEEEVRKMGLDPAAIAHPSAFVDHLIFLDANVLLSAAYRPDAVLGGGGFEGYSEQG
jgi:hypothetical protein